MMSKTRWILSITLLILSFACGLSVWRLGAANPTAGTITPISSPVSWNGTAAGGTNNGEGTCFEGVNCDTFTLTVSGTPADWNGKRIQVAVTWVVLANDYDVYIHKCPAGPPDPTIAQCNAGPVVDQSAHGAPSTSEKAFINPDTDGTGVFTVHVVYFTAEAADEYHAVATVVPSFPSSPPPPPLSKNWNINYHGECCEGNLAAAGNNTFVLLPVLVQGNKIKKSSDGGKTWTQKYPPAPASVPFGIEGDMQAFGTDVIFFGTELGVAITAHSDDFGETFVPVQNPIASAGNDQAWSYLGPFGDLRPGGPLPTDEPYVLTGWMRIGSAAIFSFDGGLTFPIQTPLVGNDGSGSVHVVCRDSAHAPTDPGDTRIPNSNFANKKSGHYGCWGTDRKFYWTEPADGANPGDRDLYVCKTDNFGITWTGIKHPIPHGPGEDYVTSHSAFDNNGTLYVLHGNKLYVSFNQGESFAFIHTLPRWGNAGRSDSGVDQFFVVDCGTIHIGLIEDAGEGRGNIFYLRGSHVDTASPKWDEELVDVVGNVRLDFMYIVVDGNGIPTISYTTPTQEVTTASRKTAPLSVGPGVCATNITPIRAVSRKVHGAAGPFDVDLLGLERGIECRTGGAAGDHTLVVTFPAPVTIATITPSCGTVSGTSTSGNDLTIHLTGVPKAACCSVTLQGVTSGTTTGDVVIPVCFLLGDTTANLAVNSSDIAQTQSQSGQLVTISNFRQDVTANGAINSSDIALVQSRSGTAP